MTKEKAIELNPISIGVAEITIVGDGDLATKNRSWGEVYKCMLATNRYRGVFMFEPKDDQKATDVVARFNDIILKSYEEIE